MINPKLFHIFSIHLISIPIKSRKNFMYNPDNIKLKWMWDKNHFTEEKTFFSVFFCFFPFFLSIKLIKKNFVTNEHNFFLYGEFPSKWFFPSQQIHTQNRNCDDKKSFHGLCTRVKIISKRQNIRHVTKLDYKSMIKGIWYQEQWEPLKRINFASLCCFFLRFFETWWIQREDSEWNQRWRLLLLSLCFLIQRNIV